MTSAVRMWLAALAGPCSFGVAQAQAQDQHPAPTDAYAYIGWPNDGEVVGRRFKVWFGARNLGVALQGSPSGSEGAAIPRGVGLPSRSSTTVADPTSGGRLGGSGLK